jgi:hypothetical protein
LAQLKSGANIELAGALRRRQDHEEPRVQLPFVGRREKKAPDHPVMPALAPDTLVSHDYAMRLQYHAKSGDGVRMSKQPFGPHQLPEVLTALSATKVDLVEPLSAEFQAAAPHITSPEEATQWINARHALQPLTRHALYVFESVDAIDPAYETLAVGLLSGAVDSAGVPRYDAIMGGLVSYWDETTGDLIVRPLVGWGGAGTRSDIDRNAQRLLARLLAAVLASQGALGLHTAERPVAVAGAKRACQHCGFTAVDRRAFYCPKCGMRL